MQSGQIQLCPSCGVTLAVPGTRCPSCGFLLASAPGPVFQNSIRPKRARPIGGPGTTVPTLLAGAVLAIFVLATCAFWLMRKRDDAARREAPSASASVVAAPVASNAPALDPNALFAQAKTLALGWHVDATLVEMDFAPVLDGRLDPSATLEFVFGRPVGKHLGPGSPVQSGLFVVTADAQGVRSAERPGANATAVAEPNCIFEDVAQKSAQSGLSTRDRLRFRYAQSQKNERGLWFVSRDGEAEPQRTLDGSNCAIIVSGAAPAAKK